jgi:hypothetical protein
MKPIKKIFIDFRNHSIVSFTQLALYLNCPLSWKLAYGLNLRSREQNIHFVFGNAIHKTIEKWLEFIHWNKIDDFRYRDYFSDTYLLEFKDAVSKNNGIFSSETELMEFSDGGYRILDHLAKNNPDYFNRDKYELLGIEVPIYYPVFEDRPDIRFLAYLDAVLRNKETGQILVIDFKTSTKEWNHYQFDDKVKIGQLLLYKYYFSKMYDVNIDDVIVEYVILARDAEIPENQVVEYVPEQGLESCDEFACMLETFVETVFNEHNQYELNTEYPALSGDNFSNCRFCEFALNEKYCPVENRR